eukprot:1190918-Prorocentrum_minimum.AAC.4
MVHPWPQRPTTCPVLQVLPTTRHHSVQCSRVWEADEYTSRGQAEAANPEYYILNRKQMQRMQLSTEPVPDFKAKYNIDPDKPCRGTKVSSNRIPSLF